MSRPSFSMCVTTLFEFTKLKTIEFDDANAVSVLRAVAFFNGNVGTFGSSTTLLAAVGDVTGGDVNVTDCDAVTGFSLNSRRPDSVLIIGLLLTSSSDVFRTTFCDVLNATDDVISDILPSTSVTSSSTSAKTLSKLFCSTAASFAAIGRGRPSLSTTSFTFSNAVDLEAIFLFAQSFTFSSDF